MDNYEAIMKMNREHLAKFLDDVYLTGFNNGMYAAKTENEEVLDEFPYDEGWLFAEAEDAMHCEPADDYILNDCARSILRLAGIDVSVL